VGSAPGQGRSEKFVSDGDKTGGLWTEVPQRGPGAEPWWESGAEAEDIYANNNCNNGLTKNPPIFSAWEFPGGHHHHHHGEDGSRPERPLYPRNRRKITNTCYRILQYMSPLPPPFPTLLPLDPAGGLLSPVSRFCPPPKQISGYAPGCRIGLCVLCERKAQNSTSVAYLEI